MAHSTAIRIGKQLGKAGVIALATFGTMAVVSAASASAEEIRPTPGVKSAQTSGTGHVKGDATHGDVRNADILEVHAHGEVRQSMIAVPGRSRGDAFRGGFRHGMPNSFR